MMSLSLSFWKNGKSFLYGLVMCECLVNAAVYLRYDGFIRNKRCNACDFGFGHDLFRGSLAYAARLHVEENIFSETSDGSAVFAGDILLVAENERNRFVHDIRGEKQRLFLLVACRT